MAGTITVDTIQSDSSYASVLNIPSKVNFTGGMQIGGQDTTFGGMRNRVINGAMRIDQRNSGGSVSAAGNGSVVYPADRIFLFNYTATSNTTVTGQRVAVTDNIGFDYAVRATIGNMTSRSQYDGRFQYNFEGNMVSDYVVGTTTMTATFWARASKSGYAYYSLWASNTGTGAYFYKRVALTTSWQKFTVQIPACNVSGAAILRDHQRGFGSGLYWAQAGWVESFDGQWMATAQLGNTGRDDFATSSDWIEFTGYQLEFGNTATGFEYRPYPVEFQLCQRYYQTGRFVCYPFVYTNVTGSGAGTAQAYNVYSNEITLGIPMRTSGGTITPYRYDKTAITNGSYVSRTTNEADYSGLVNSAPYLRFTEPNTVFIYFTTSNGWYPVPVYFTASAEL